MAVPVIDTIFMTNDNEAVFDFVVPFSECIAESTHVFSGSGAEFFDQLLQGFFTGIIGIVFIEVVTFVFKINSFSQFRINTPDQIEEFEEVKFLIEFVIKLAWFSLRKSDSSKAGNSKQKHITPHTYNEGTALTADPERR